MDGVPLDSHEITQECGYNEDEDGQEASLEVPQSVETNDGIADEPVLHDCLFHLLEAGRQEFQEELIVA